MECNIRQIPRKKALVFGERSTAQIIGKQLMSEGFEPVFQDRFLGNKRLPSLADPSRLRCLRRLLKDFSKGANRSGLVHPGVTAWAERPELSIIAEEFGLTVVCPPAKTLSLFGNKLNLLLEAKKLGVPNAILNFDPMHTVREVDDFLEETGQKLPFVLKAAKGRGSASLFVVKDRDTFRQDLTLWIEQLRRNVGEVIFFAEKYVDGARHVVVPFCRFQDGRTWVFPMTDISLQCRYRKMVEICPARQVTQVATSQLVEWTTHLAGEFGYVGVGAFEYLVDGSSIYLIEGVARLNAGFHLWESISETSVVAWQLAAINYYSPLEVPCFRNALDQPGAEARGLPRLDDSAGMPFGISARIYAEDSVYHLPQPGWIHEISQESDFGERLPEVRTECSLNYRDQEFISSDDSGIVALLFAYGKERSEVLSCLRQMLQDFWVMGTVQTNQRFIFELLQHPWVEEEIFYAGFIDDEYIPNISDPEEVRELFLGVSYCLPEIRQIEFPGLQSKWLIGNRNFRSDSPAILQAHSRLIWKQGPSYWNHKDRTAFSGVLKLRDGGSVRVSVFPAEDYWLIRIGFWFSLLKRVVARKSNEELTLKALSSGVVHAVLFLEGVNVPAHEPLLTLEAFGVLVPHALPVEVRIGKWLVEAEEQVHEGQDLADLIRV